MSEWDAASSAEGSFGDDDVEKEIAEEEFVYAESKTLFGWKDTSIATKGADLTVISLCADALLGSRLKWGLLRRQISIVACYYLFGEPYTIQDLRIEFDAGAAAISKGEEPNTARMREEFAARLRTNYPDAGCDLAPEDFPRHECIGWILEWDSEETPFHCDRIASERLFLATCARYYNCRISRSDCRLPEQVRRARLADRREFFGGEECPHVLAIFWMGKYGDYFPTTWGVTPRNALN